MSLHFPNLSFVFNWFFSLWNANLLIHYSKRSTAIMCFRSVSVFHLFMTLGNPEGVLFFFYCFFIIFYFKSNKPDLVFCWWNLAIRFNFKQLLKRNSTILVYFKGLFINYIKHLYVFESTRICFFALKIKSRLVFDL